MRLVTYQSVLWDTARLLGLDPQRDLTSGRAATLTAYLNQAVREGWQFDFFPEWTPVERRAFRPFHRAEDFVEAGHETYHAPSQRYFQALRQQLTATEAPATLVAGVWTENSAYWAALQSEYTAILWASGESLEVGDQRQHPDNFEFYQCHTAHTAGASFDFTQFGVLTPFSYTIAYEQAGKTPLGEVKRVCTRDPRAHPEHPGELHFSLTAAGVLVRGAVPPQVWLEFRERWPVYSSTPWVSGIAYDLDALVFYRGSASAGDTFRSLVGDNSAALENTSNWARVPCPAILAGFLQYAAAAAALTDQKQNSRALHLRGLADRELADVRDRELGSQGQYDRAAVYTYGS